MEKESTPQAVVKNSGITMYHILGHYKLLHEMTLTGQSPFNGGAKGKPFRIVPSGYGWYDHTLDENGGGGDVIAFVQRREGVSAKEAAQLIIEWFKLDEELSVTKGYIAAQKKRLEEILGKKDLAAEALLAEVALTSWNNAREYERKLHHVALTLFALFQKQKRKR